MFKVSTYLLIPLFVLMAFFVFWAQPSQATAPPDLNVAIPGLTFKPVSLPIVKAGQETKLITIPWIQDYTNGIYGFLLIAAGIIAMTMIMIGGTLYAASGGNQNQIAKGQDMIISAISGLILLFLVYTILYYLNPRIVENEGITVRVPVNKNDARELTDISKECGTMDSIDQCYTCMAPKLRALCEKKYECKEGDSVCQKEASNCANSAQEPFKFDCTETAAACHDQAKQYVLQHQVKKSYDITYPGYKAIINMAKACFSKVKVYGPRTAQEIIDQSFSPCDKMPRGTKKQNILAGKCYDKAITEIQKNLY